MSESNPPPTSPDGEHPAAAAAPERFWGPAPELPPQPEYQLPPDPERAFQHFPQAAVAFTPDREYAAWVMRVFANVIDFALLVPWYVLAHLGEPSPSGANSRLGSLVWFGGYSVLACFALWNSVIRQGLRGSTLGKSWLSMRVVGEQTGYEIGIARALVRTLLHIVNTVPLFLGYLWPIWDRKKQTFSDKITDTVVIMTRIG